MASSTTNFIGNEIKKSKINIKNNVTENYIEVANINQKNLRNFQFNLPPIVNITGRDEEVKVLTELIKTEKRVVLSGMGGVGKTSLSAHCARKWSTGSFFKHWFRQFEHVIFIDTETDITMENSIMKLCKHPKIGLHFYESSETAYYMQLVYQKVTRGNLLIIFDNVVSFPSVQNYLPPLEQDNITTVLTSQNIEFGSSFYVYKLKVLSKKSCLELIKNQFGEQWTVIENQLETIEQLMEKLQFLPLAVCQAVAYVKDQLTYGDKYYTIRHYLDNFETNLKVSFPEYKEEIYKHSAFTAINMNISQLKQNREYGQKAQLALYCMQYLDPSSISEDLLLPLFGLRGNDITEVKRLLQKYSLVDYDNSNTTIDLQRSRWFRSKDQLQHITYDNRKYMNIHRLVQETCRILTKNDDEFVLYFKNVLKEVLISDNYRSHLQFLKPYVENYGTNVLNELYIELYNSDPRRQILEDAFSSAEYDISAVEEWTVVNYAMFEGNKGMLYLLKSTGHSLTVVRVFEMLHLVTLYKNRHLRDILDLALGSINKQDSDGNTVLHLILSKGVNQCFGWGECKRCPIALQLIQAGSDINLINKDGDSAANLAVEINHIEICLHMLKHCVTNIFLHEQYNIGEWRVKEHIAFCKLYPENENRPFYGVMYVEALSTIQAGVELLKERVGQSAPDTVWQEIICLVYNVPEALQLAAAYIHSRELTVTDFQEHFITFSESILAQTISRNFYRYRNICILACGILENVRHDHNLSYVVLTHLACTQDRMLSERTLYSLLHKESHENILAGLEVLNKWSLVEKDENDCYSVSRIVQYVTLIYVQHRRELEAVCATHIVHGLYGRLYVRYLGESGVRTAYMDRYSAEPDINSRWLDGLCRSGLLTDTDITQFTALHWAVAYFSSDVVKELLALGASVNAATDRGVTLLHLAKVCLSIDIEECLLEAGGDIDRRDVTGRTPHDWSKRLSH